MATMPGPRTHPTVKPLISANRRSLRDWEVKLGPVQSVVLLGVITGSMACSFYLGFFAGKKTGLEAALDSLVANAAKLPIEIDASDNASEDESDQIYAKLNTNSVPPADSKKVAADILDGSAKLNTTESANKNALGFSSPKTADNKKDDSTVVKILGEELDSGIKLKDDSSAVKLFADSTQADKTLGMVLEEKKAADQVAKQQDKEQSANASLSITDLSKAAAKFNAESKSEISALKTKELDKAESGASKTASKKVAEPKAETKNIEAKVVAPTTKSFARKSIPKGWFAQVGAPTKLSDAEALSQNLASGGFAVMIETAQVRGQGYYRVLVGPEGSKEQSEILVKQLKREKYLKGEPFIRLIK